MASTAMATSLRRVNGIAALCHGAGARGPSSSAQHPYSLPLPPLCSSAMAIHGSQQLPQVGKQGGLAGTESSFCRGSSLFRRPLVFSQTILPIPSAARLIVRETVSRAAAFGAEGSCCSRAMVAAALSAVADTAKSGQSAAPRRDDATEDGAEASSLAPQLCLYNTMSRQKEVFRPKVEGKVGMYVCGVTAYDYSHIGHARVYVAFDVLYRYLRHLGYEVTYVRNFTDVDDKIINRAAELGEDPLVLSQRFCEEFQVDMALLHCLPPTIEPRVSTHINEIVAMIDKIIDNGYGYAVEGGDVYFSVDKYSEYGELSGRKLDENRAGERVAVDERKRNPFDFVLWKSAKPGEVSWVSPWGRGRPGWHIECSAMSARHLSHSFDIHGGGRDLVFPHHENELAQSRAACSSSNVSYWLHNGFVNVDKEKMSKSLGNFFTIRQVLETYHPTALRWFLLGTQYRSPINYSQRQLEQASDRIYYLYQVLGDCDVLFGDARGTDGPPGKEASQIAEELRRAFRESMADDLHTSLAVAAFSEPLKAMNDLIHTKKGRKDKSRLASLRALHEAVLEILSVLGLPTDGCLEILQELRTLALKRAELSEEQLDAFVKERAAAREAKQWERSDDIRKALAERGIMLMDGVGAPQWRPAPLPSTEEGIP